MKPVLMDASTMIMKISHAISVRKGRKGCCVKRTAIQQRTVIMDGMRLWTLAFVMTAMKVNATRWVTVTPARDVQLE